ncbi:3-phosphoserine/phosphohydroxythreonine transaminase [Chitinophagaceae bacterium MMS25-I14]
MRNRLINFNAGPAALPQEVLQQAAAAIQDYNGIGSSILEIPHRGKHFEAVLEEANALTKELCGLNDDYKILWLQGGGRMQFAMVPMNFLGADDTAGYIDSGHWSNEAAESASYYGKTSILASSRGDNYTHLPQWPEITDSRLKYVHITTNNTIYGTQWRNIPSCEVPLIADMSSDILSCKRDYTNYAMFYAVAQKNLGAAGNTMVAIRKDMLGRIVRKVPEILDYNALASKNSMVNTPPVFAIYVSLLVMRWIKNKGMDTIAQENTDKANLLYGELERNPLFTSLVEKESRSQMNVVFRGTGKEMEQAFLKACTEQGITGIEGHRSVGAFRASLYNAITLQDVQQLVNVMQEFEKNYK